MSRPGALLVLLVLALLARPGTAQDGLLAERAAFDVELRDPNISLLDPRVQRVFEGIPYFPIDPAFRVQATFTPTPDGKPFGMPTSAGTEQFYVEAGTLTFEIGGESLVLHAYEGLTITTDSLFVPFRDATSGTESYGGGRYLYVALPVEEVVTLDFNTVSNPYCAYNPAYACPLPPEENTLSVAIRAGEKAPPPSWLDALLAPIPDAWEVYDSPLGHFQIAFPYPPQTSEQVGDSGPDLEMMTLSVDTLGLAAVVLTAPVVVPAAQRPVFLERTVERLGLESAILNRSDSVLDGQPAVRLTLRTEAGLTEALVAMTDRQLVTLTASPSGADLFFESARWTRTPPQDGE